MLSLHCLHSLLVGADAKAAMLEWTPANYIGNATQQAKNLSKHLKNVV